MENTIIRQSVTAPSDYIRPPVFGDEKSAQAIAQTLENATVCPSHYLSAVELEPDDRNRQAFILQNKKHVERVARLFQEHVAKNGKVDVYPKEDHGYIQASRTGKANFYELSKMDRNGKASTAQIHYVLDKEPSSPSEFVNEFYLVLGKVLCQSSKAYPLLSEWAGLSMNEESKLRKNRVADFFFGVPRLGSQSSIVKHDHFGRHVLCVASVIYRTRLKKSFIFGQFRKTASSGSNAHVLERMRIALDGLSIYRRIGKNVRTGGKFSQVFQSHEPFVDQMDETLHKIKSVQDLKGCEQGKIDALLMDVFHAHGETPFTVLEELAQAFCNDAIRETKYFLRDLADCLEQDAKKTIAEPFLLNQPLLRKRFTRDKWIRGRMLSSYKEGREILPSDLAQDLHVVVLSWVDEDLNKLSACVKGIFTKEIYPDDKISPPQSITVVNMFDFAKNSMNLDAEKILNAEHFPSTLSHDDCFKFTAMLAQSQIESKNLNKDGRTLIVNVYPDIECDWVDCLKNIAFAMESPSLSIQGVHLSKLMGDMSNRAVRKHFFLSALRPLSVFSVKPDDRTLATMTKKDHAIYWIGSVFPMPSAKRQHDARSASPSVTLDMCVVKRYAIRQNKGRLFMATDTPVMVMNMAMRSIIGHRRKGKHERELGEGIDLFLFNPATFERRGNSDFVGSLMKRLYNEHEIKKRRVVMAGVIDDQLRISKETLNSRERNEELGYECLQNASLFDRIRETTSFQAMIGFYAPSPVNNDASYKHGKILLFASPQDAFGSLDDIRGIVEVFTMGVSEKSSLQHTVRDNRLFLSRAHEVHYHTDARRKVHLKMNIEAFALEIIAEYGAN